MKKKKLKFLSSDNDEFVFLFILRQFKKFKTKSILHIDISSGEDDKSFSSFILFQFSAKNIDFRRNDSIIARSNLKKLIKDRN